MSRKVLLLPLLAVAFLAVPTMLPAAFGPGLSGSAHAVTNLNSSRSNIARAKRATIKNNKSNSYRATTVKSSKSNTSDRMGGGGGGTLRATTVKSSKSNTSDRMGGGGGGLGRMGIGLGR